MRFIIRTGIFHTCSDIKHSDPLNKESLHEVLTVFCSRYLKGKIIEGLNLGVCPGIVDIFIWSYCSKELFNICGSEPRCEECRLNKKCMYSISR
jgi:hypothetical protein